MLFIAYLIGALLFLSVVAWVYFDATELGKPAIPWAIAQPVLIWFFFLPLVLYAIFREQGQRRHVPPGGARRQAVYIVSFIGYSAAAYGLAALVGVLMVGLTAHVGDNALSEVISSSVAAIVVGGAMWVVAWLPADRRVQAIADDEEFRATFYLHRAYLYTIVGLAVLTLVVFGLWLLTGLVMSIAGSEDIDVEVWTWTVGPLLTATIALALHYGFYLNSPRYLAMLDRFESIPPLPMVGGPAPATVTAASVAASVPAGPAAAAPAASVWAPPAAQAQAGAANGDTGFCRHCGNQLRPGDAFCARCGNAV